MQIKNWRSLLYNVGKDYYLYYVFFDRLQQMHAYRKEEGGRRKGDISRFVSVFNTSDEKSALIVFR